jgi:bifunctional DNA-binding transcriptional regulator/antitoxin component of YhaV-PrlF toxin-antitoxin module
VSVTRCLKCHFAGTMELMRTTYGFEVKDKGRAVLPAGLRRECGFDVGAKLIARPLGPGRAILETADAVLERIWSGAPEEPVDAVDELRRWRAEDAGKASTTSQTTRPDAGQVALRALGLV